MTWLLCLNYRIYSKFLITKNTFHIYTRKLFKKNKNWKICQVTPRDRNKSENGFNRKKSDKKTIYPPHTEFLWIPISLKNSIFFLLLNYPCYMEYSYVGLPRTQINVWPSESLPRKWDFFLLHHSGHISGNAPCWWQDQKKFRRNFGEIIWKYDISSTLWICSFIVPQQILIY